MTHKAISLPILAVILLIFSLFTGCGGSGGSGEKATSRKLFVVNSGGDSVSVFELDDILSQFTPDGNVVANVAPIRTIGSKSEISQPEGIFVDTMNNEIFVANAENNTITVYDRTAEGDAPPKRTINTGLSRPQGIFVDTVNNEIFIVSFDEPVETITVYNRTDSGNATPKRKIMSEELSQPSAISVDVKNNEIFVTSFSDEDRIGSILIYDRMADSGADEINISPKANSIKLDQLTDEGFPLSPQSLFIDSDKGELFVVDLATMVQGANIIPGFDLDAFPVQRTFDSTVKIYKRMTNGQFSDKPEIVRGQDNGLLMPIDLSVNTITGEIFVLNVFNNTVTVYGRNGNDGKVRFLRTLRIADFNNAGTLADRQMSFGIFADALNNELFIANLNKTITVYNETDTGDAPPKRVLGAGTGLLEPNWIYVDANRNEIFVTNIQSNLITVYDTNDSGNTSPLRTIFSRRLVGGVWADTFADELFAASSFVGGANAISAIAVYGITNQTLLNNIFGPKTGLAEPRGVFVDQENILVANFDNGTVTVYERSATGDEEPKGVIMEGLFSPQGVFANPENIFVTDSDNNTVTVYPSNNNNRDFPLVETIRKGLSSPTGIFADKENIYVANSGGNSISVYRRTEGFRLLGVIQGGNTKLNQPYGIFIADTQ